MRIAVTGGLGSGKSSMGRVLAVLLGARYLSADELCRCQLLPGAEGYDLFTAGRGSEFLLENGELDRPALGRAVFADPSLRHELEEILHPIVRRQLLEAGGQLLVAEVPLLYESGWEGDFAVTVGVCSGQEQKIKRVVLRDGRTHTEVQQILQAQLSEEEKLRHVDYVIDNSGLFCSSWGQCAHIASLIRREFSITAR